MKYLLSMLIGITLLSSSCSQKLNIKKAFAQANIQTALLLKETDQANQNNPKDFLFPRTLEDGKLKLVKSKDWTSGFFPGTLWYLYEYNKNTNWLDAAKRYTIPLTKEQFNTGTHDLGFIIYDSFGNGYRLSGDPTYKPVIVQAAKSLSKRFSPKTGVIRSWDHHKDKWQFPVIIDNMMNLELLFEATKLSGDSSFYKIAVSHADQTLKNHFRPDYSSFHVIDYNPENGKVLKKNTHQGFSDESAWARGQAWALYGYTVCYRETKNEAYLKQAENVAQFILNHKNLPKDLIPYWDFNDPQIPNVSRDVSSAAIIASALYELRGYSKNTTLYTKTADKILASLYDKYTSKPGENKGFILEQSTGNRPKNDEVNVPLNYADYFYMEALLRKKKLRK